MKQISTLLTVLAIYQFVSGQEFSFQMCFEDALGFKDTLVFGYDDSATETIDIAFGEFNIISTPFGSILETRISDYDFSTTDQYIPDPTTFQTKTQIKKKDCASSTFPLVSAINLSKVNFPLKVYWNASLFGDSCKLQSLITDWHPGGWFDAGHGGEQGPFYLNSNDTVIFTHTTQHYVTTVSDTIDVLFITIASSHNIIAGIWNPLDQSYLNIFPNPTTDHLSILLSNSDLKIKTVQLFDLSGKEYQIAVKKNSVDVSSVMEGIYLIRLTFQNEQTVLRKIVIHNAR